MPSTFFFFSPSGSSIHGNNFGRIHKLIRFPYGPQSVKNFTCAYFDIAFSRWDIAAEMHGLVYLFKRVSILLEDGSILIKTHELLFYRSICLCAQDDKNINNCVLKRVKFCYYSNKYFFSLSLRSILLDKFNPYCILIFFFSAQHKIRLSYLGSWIFPRDVVSCCLRLGILSFLSIFDFKCFIQRKPTKPLITMQKIQKKRRN